MNRFYEWLVLYTSCDTEWQIVALLKRTYAGEFGLVVKHFFFEADTFAHGVDKFFVTQQETIADLGYSARTFQRGLDGDDSEGEDIIIDDSESELVAAGVPVRGAVAQRLNGWLRLAVGFPDRREHLEVKP